MLLISSSLTLPSFRERRAGGLQPQVGDCRPTDRRKWLSIKKNNQTKTQKAEQKPNNWNHWKESEHKYQMAGSAIAFLMVLLMLWACKLVCKRRTNLLVCVYEFSNSFKSSRIIFRRVFTKISMVLVKVIFCAFCWHFEAQRAAGYSAAKECQCSLVIWPWKSQPGPN